ncbi:hypothetical protein ACQ4M4_05775 [Leptolyngbya sp. AN02str]|uniref:hypothetical protein n=1 Tax=Leptolyngbya sp. AN02str TaxID=3423363 RepID=UPI003D31309C
MRNLNDIFLFIYRAHDEIVAKPYRGQQNSRHIEQGIERHPKQQFALVHADLLHKLDFLFVLAANGVRLAEDWFTMLNVQHCLWVSACGLSVMSHGSLLGQEAKV